MQDCDILDKAVSIIERYEAVASSNPALTDGQKTEVRKVGVTPSEDENGCSGVLDG